MPHRMSWTRVCQSQTDINTQSYIPKNYFWDIFGALNRVAISVSLHLLGQCATPSSQSSSQLSHFSQKATRSNFHQNTLKLPLFKTHSLHSLFSLRRPQIDLLIPDAGDVNNSTGVETWILSPVSRSRSRSSLQSGLFWFSGRTSLATAHTHSNRNTVILLRVSRLVSGFETGDLWLPTNSVVIASQQLN